MSEPDKQPVANQKPSPKKWVKTPVANLIRYEPSGVYFARVRIAGKLFRESLKTDVFSVAKLRLSDFIKERRTEFNGIDKTLSGNMTFSDALQVFLKRLDGNPDLKDGAKIYRRKCVTALLKSWTDLENTNVRKISKDECLAWAEQFAKLYSATVYNNTVGTLRMVLNIAIEKGARTNNPALHIVKKRVSQKHLILPEIETFQKFVNHIENGGGWCSKDCANLVRFLAYGGLRKTEAANITWADCDFTNELIKVRITKGRDSRTIPMIPEMLQLLQSIKAGRPNEHPSAKVMKVQECQKAMDRAAKTVGMARITHHDLRHLFATRCIESGVDIPTVSRWLGHKDGGALAMKVYGHLRNQHSSAMAQKVSFISKP